MTDSTKSMTELDNIEILLTKIMKRDTYRMNDDNEVFAKTLLYIAKRVSK